MTHDKRMFIRGRRIGRRPQFRDELQDVCEHILGVATSAIWKAAVPIDKELRRTADSRMPSEWAKKADCWKALRELTLELPDPLPAEMQAQIAGGTARSTEPASRNAGQTREDLDLIEKCRQIDAPTWFKVAQWGVKSKAIHWRVAGIAKTVGEYAIGGWERSPSAKQAKWAMEAYKTAENAGALSTSRDPV